MSSTTSAWLEPAPVAPAGAISTPLAFTIRTLVPPTRRPSWSAPTCSTPVLVSEVNVYTAPEPDAWTDPMEYKW